MNLLDTSILIELLRRGALEEGSISVITLIEVLRGVPAHKRNEVKSSLEELYEIISLNNDVVNEYCKLYEKLKSIGVKVPDADLLIAASAKAKNLTLVTSDKHFEQLRELGLKVEIRQIE
ncbi:MAG: type II toxin-antitoxin system VapC family toxin [Nitrososphaerota archaeon]